MQVNKLDHVIQTALCTGWRKRGERATKKRYSPLTPPFLPGNKLSVEEIWVILMMNRKDKAYFSTWKLAPRQYII